MLVEETSETNLSVWMGTSFCLLVLCLEGHSCCSLHCFITFNKELYADLLRAVQVDKAAGGNAWLIVICTDWACYHARNCWFVETWEYCYIPWGRRIRGAFRCETNISDTWLLNN